MENIPAPIREFYARIADLNAAAALLEWDQETYMPAGAGDSRAAQLATLRSLSHELATSVEARKAVDTLRSLTAQHPGNPTLAALSRVASRDLEKATKLPSRFVHQLTEAEALAKTAWRSARESNDFHAFAPHLLRVVTLNREKAELLGYTAHPYDALLDQYEPGATTADIVAAFDQLRQHLVPLVEELRPHFDDRAALLHRTFDEQTQWEVGERLMKRVGYDFSRGRQDRSAHPFCTSFSITDVRVTTRVDRNFFSPAFFGTLHEVGHALYEQGIDARFERTPLADGTSLGVHESQSRLWENLVGRSMPFVEFVFPWLADAFPDALVGADASDFYRAINAVEPALIRVEADEVTYNLHVMLRFELELALMEDNVSISDLPEAWNELSEEFLGIRPETAADGVLQDIHWSMGAFGYFPTYSLGNLMASQLYETAAVHITDLEGQIRAGRFENLLSWLRENVHRYGRARTADEILTEVTGRGLDARPWLSYIRKKYSDLYDVHLHVIDAERP